MSRTSGGAAVGYPSSGSWFNAASDALSSFEGIRLLSAGKQLLDSGGDSMELAVLAKRSAVDVVCADLEISSCIDRLADLYQDAALLLEGAGAEHSELGRLATSYAQREVSFRQARSLLKSGGKIPEMPTMTPEESQAARVLLPMRETQAGIGLRGPVGGARRRVPPRQVMSGCCSENPQLAAPAPRQAGQGDVPQPARRRPPPTPPQSTLLPCFQPGNDDVEEEIFPRRLRPRRVSTSSSSAESSVWQLDLQEWDALFLPQCYSCRKDEGDGRPVQKADSLLDKAEKLPAASLPPSEPLTCVHIAGIGLDDVRNYMLSPNEPWPFVQFIEEDLLATNFRVSEWKDVSRIPGTQTRGVTFVMPLPNDVPKSVSRLVAVPESSRATCTFRVRCSDEEVVVLRQTTTHDTPYGENFRVQECLGFRPANAVERGAASNGEPGLGLGVEMRKWVEVVWVEALPWALGMLSGFIETKARDGAMKATDGFVESLKKYSKEGGVFSLTAEL